MFIKKKSYFYLVLLILCFGTTGYGQSQTELAQYNQNINAQIANSSLRFNCSMPMESVENLEDQLTPNALSSFEYIDDYRDAFKVLKDDACMYFKSSIQESIDEICEGDDEPEAKVLLIQEVYAENKDDLENSREDHLACLNEYQDLFAEIQSKCLPQERSINVMNESLVSAECGSVLTVVRDYLDL